MVISDESKCLSERKEKSFGVATIPWVQTKLYLSPFCSDIPVAIPERMDYEKDMQIDLQF